MTEETMPAVEAQDVADTDEVARYECAFHILPTIAEEEVPGVVQKLKELVTRAGGTIVSEEAPGHYDLAYDVVTKVDGANKRFNASYFGWIRYTLASEAALDLAEELNHMPEIFRHLTIRLTREEDAQPFVVFEARRAKERAAAERAAARAEARGEAPAEAEESGEEGTEADEAQ